MNRQNEIVDALITGAPLNLGHNIQDVPEPIIHEDAAKAQEEYEFRTALARYSDHEIAAMMKEELRGTEKLATIKKLI